MIAIGKIKIAMIVAAMVFACGSADAQRWHRYGYHGHAAHVAHTACMAYPAHVTVVSRPAVTTHISNRLNQKERFHMAMAYMKSNGSLTVKQYSKMTGLTRDSQGRIGCFRSRQEQAYRLGLQWKETNLCVEKKSIELFLRI